MSTTGDVELALSESSVLLGVVTELPPHSKHAIFLSHSGAQKNFVEQLCLDLELKLHLTPFFDKRPNCLPKGEVFADYIFAAAEECELAIVVVSEEYFSRSKWPMLELAAFVHTKKCKILPLFLGLTCQEFKEAERRERWFRTWEDWARCDPRVKVEEWKLAVRELDRRNGMQYASAIGEVGFRKEVLATVEEIMPGWVLVEKEETANTFAGQCGGQLWPRWSSTLDRLLVILKVFGGKIGSLIGYVIFCILFFSFGFKSYLSYHLVICIITRLYKTFLMLTTHKRF